MNKSIDIVVTYVCEKDEKWQQDFNYWKQKEIEEGKALENNRQAFGIERTREWNTLKYWFRCIENNCKWVNKIFLIVQNQSQIPQWLDTTNPQLRIVYHDEFIPQKLLPTFNAMTIGLYISNIADLSNNYIMCDDDFYFLNPIDEFRFFVNNVPVHYNNEVPYELYNNNLLNNSDGVFYQILNNNLNFETKITNKKTKYGIYHLPEARNKTFEQIILKSNNNEILSANSKSKFRNKHNLCAYMFSDLLKICNKATFGNPYINCCYCTLKSTVDFNDYANKDIVCFNDTEQLDNFELTKEKLIQFFENKFPKKSKFEK